MGQGVCRLIGAKCSPCRWIDRRQRRTNRLSGLPFHGDRHICGSHLQGFTFQRRVTEIHAILRPCSALTALLCLGIGVLTGIESARVLRRINTSLWIVSWLMRAITRHRRATRNKCVDLNCWKHGSPSIRAMGVVQTLARKYAAADALTMLDVARVHSQCGRRLACAVTHQGAAACCKIMIAAILPMGMNDRGLACHWRFPRAPVRDALRLAHGGAAVLST